MVAVGLIIVHKHLLSAYYVRVIIFRLHWEAGKHKTKSLLSHAQKNPQTPNGSVYFGTNECYRKKKAFKS